MENEGLLHTSAVNQLMGRLGAFRSDLRALNETLKALADVKETPTRAELKTIARQVRELKEYESSFRRPLDESPLLAFRVSEKVEDLCRYVDQAVVAAGPLKPGSPYWPPAPSLADVKAAAATTVKSLDAAAKAVTELTLAEKVKDALHRRPVGKSLLFDELAKKDLPSEDDRKEAFAEFATNAGYFEEGVFDVSERRIWRKSSRQGERVFTYFTPVLFGLLGLSLLWLLSELVPDDSKLSGTGDLLRGYALVLGGVVLHLLIESTKQSQADTHPIIPIGEFLDWLHLRWVSLGVSYFHVLVTVVGLRAMGIGVSSDEDILLFVFGGYSVDSIAGLFLTRFGTASTTRLQRVMALARGQTKAS